MAKKLEKNSKKNNVKSAMGNKVVSSKKTIKKNSAKKANTKRVKKIEIDETPKRKIKINLDFVKNKVYKFKNPFSKSFNFQEIKKVLKRKDKKDDEKDAKTKNIVSIKNVNKKFQNNQVLRNFSLDIKEGETFVILGKSGSGKSVAIRLANELETPDKGKIYVFGKKITGFWSGNI